MKFFTASCFCDFFCCFLFCLRFADLRFWFLAFLVVIFIGWAWGARGAKNVRFPWYL